MFLLYVLVKSLVLFAHQNSLNASGKELRWSQVELPYQFIFNTTDLSALQAQQIFIQSINQWNSVGTKKIISSSSSANQIVFEKNFRYGSGVLGITELNFGTDGTIQKAVIRLNDDYYFRSTPGKYSFGQFYLGDVLTHEIGHSLGLSHSEVIGSTMFYSSFSGQHSLHLDDTSGLRQKYSQDYGEIRGVVMGGESVPVLGAHVQAISLKTGESSGAISNEFGQFKLGGLDLNDSYYLYVSPTKRVESLPGYFSNIQSNFCPGKYVGSFFSSCDPEDVGLPQPITLNSTRLKIDIGVVSISCSLKTQSSYQREKLKSTFLPYTVFDSQDVLLTKKSFVGYFRNLQENVWSKEDIFKVDLSHLNLTQSNLKKMKLAFISQPLGSRMEIVGEIMDESEESIQKLGLFLDPIDGIFKTDLKFEVNLSQDPLRNIYLIKLKARKLSPSLASLTFPSSEEFSSETDLPYLMTLNLTDTNGMVVLDQNEQLLEDNRSCLDAPLTYRVSQAASARDDNKSNEDTSTSPMTCATTGEPPSSSGGASLLIGFFLMTLMFKTHIKPKKFLS